MFLSGPCICGIGSIGTDKSYSAVDLIGTFDMYNASIMSFCQMLCGICDSAIQMQSKQCTV